MGVEEAISQMFTQQRTLLQIDVGKMLGISSFSCSSLLFYHMFQHLHGLNMHCQNIW